MVPEEAGLMRAPISRIKGGGPEENAERLTMLLKGRGPIAETRVVALNTGALLMAAGLVDTLREGVDVALQTIASGAPHERLLAFVDATHG
jgi:anthranilate phosphoribosyltransferase